MPRISQPVKSLTYSNTDCYKGWDNITSLKGQASRAHS